MVHTLFNLKMNAKVYYAIIRFGNQEFLGCKYGWVLYALAANKVKVLVCFVRTMSVMLLVYIHQFWAAEL
ncbi:hypothetical protein VNO77_18422 [Canavalia gladiata]|uniref:Uncharacterized protein n=1 Tax=Canavalia gladiata TaxID=3824 RepID=A0AAN9QHN4_CANGL